jgi:hypothetical protein
VRPAPALVQADLLDACDGRAARYTFLVCLADQIRQVLDRNPVGDPTANRIVPPVRTSGVGVAFGTSLMTSRLVTFVHPVTTNER